MGRQGYGPPAPGPDGHVAAHLQLPQFRLSAMSTISDNSSMHTAVRIPIQHQLRQPKQQRQRPAAAVHYEDAHINHGQASRSRNLTPRGGQQGRRGPPMNASSPQARRQAQAQAQQQQQQFINFSSPPRADQPHPDFASSPAGAAPMQMLAPTSAPTSRKPTPTRHKSTRFFPEDFLGPITSKFSSSVSSAQSGSHDDPRSRDVSRQVSSSQQRPQQQLVSFNVDDTSSYQRSYLGFLHRSNSGQGWGAGRRSTRLGSQRQASGGQRLNAPIPEADPAPAAQLQRAESASRAHNFPGFGASPSPHVRQQEQQQSQFLQQQQQERQRALYLQQQQQQYEQEQYLQQQQQQQQQGQQQYLQPIQQQQQYPQPNQSQQQYLQPNHQQPPRRSRFASLLYDDPRASLQRGTWGFFQFDAARSTVQVRKSMALGGALGINTMSTSLGHLDQRSFSTHAKMAPQGHGHGGYIDGASTQQLSHGEAAALAEVDASYPTGWRLACLLLTLSLTLFIVSMDETIMATIIPSIVAEFESLTDMGWYASGYLMASCSFQLVFGKIYRLFSIRWTYAVAVLGYAVGCVISAIAPVPQALILGRVVAGLSQPGVTTGSFIILAEIVPYHKRTFYTALIIALAALATIAGPLLGGALATYATWRTAFYIKLACLASVPTIAFLLPSSSPTAKNAGDTSTWWQKVRQLDFLGLSLLLGLLVSLLLVLSWGGDEVPWRAPRVIIVSVITLVHAVLFVCSQVWWSKDPLIPGAVLRQRSIAFGCAFSFCTSAAMGIFMYYMPLWLQGVLGENPLTGGLYLLPAVLSLIFGAILAANLVPTLLRGHYAPLMVLGAALLAGGLGLAAAAIGPGSPPAAWIGYFVFVGFAAGLGLQQPLLAAQVVLPHEDVPAGVALVIAAQSAGGAIFLAAAKAVFVNVLGRDVAAKMVAGASSSSSGDDGSVLWGAADPTTDETKDLNDAIHVVLFVAVVMAGLGFLLSLGMEWRSTRGPAVGDGEKDMDEAGRGGASEGPLSPRSFFDYH